MSWVRRQVAKAVGCGSLVQMPLWTRLPQIAQPSVPNRMPATQARGVGIPTGKMGRPNFDGAPHSIVEGRFIGGPRARVSPAEEFMAIIRKPTGASKLGIRATALSRQRALLVKAINQGPVQDRCGARARAHAH